MSAKGLFNGLFATVILAGLIVIGSRRLSHFDAALVAYTFASLFAFFGIVYRYTVWLQKPPTKLYWRRGWQIFFQPKRLPSHLISAARHLVTVFALNDFIFRRSVSRWAAHMLIMWGCIIAAAITFPLVFGWIHFETRGDDFSRYTILMFGFPTLSIPVDSWLAFIIFHGLVWSSLLVIPGVMLAMWRRMREHGAAAVQSFGEDLLPLILLFAVSVTGILLWVSYSFMDGYGYDFLALFHAVTVVVTLIWLPFGKFFHIFQRPAQMSIYYYKEAGQDSEQAHCKRCGEAYASQMHVEDLIEVEAQLGYRYSMPDTDQGHYQRICPTCRRKLAGLAQMKLVNPAQ